MLQLAYRCVSRASGSRVLIVSSGGVDVAHLEFVADARCLRIIQCRVADECQRKGIGTGLLHAAEDVGRWHELGEVIISKVKLCQALEGRGYYADGADVVKSLQHPLHYERHMTVAIAQAELARGETGDNPWVGCVIIDGDGRVVAKGHTHRPGEDHAEMDALRQISSVRVRREFVLLSTLEPCSFHGRTPPCAQAIIDSGIRTVVVGMRDPHHRVDGAGLRMLRAAGIRVVEGTCEADIFLQLEPWLLAQHPRELRRREELMRKSHEASLSDPRIPALRLRPAKQPR